jgi:hypothetical protein
MTERGVIKNRNFKTQVADMSGLTFGKITPTDLDAFMDFNNKLFVFVEAKHGNSVMPFGQQLAIERLCDACHKPPHRYAVVFVTSHNADGDIDFANTTVTKYRWEGKWITPQKLGSTLFDGVVRFRGLCLDNVVSIRRAA